MIEPSEFPNDVEPLTGGVTGDFEPDDLFFEF